MIMARNGCMEAKTGHDHERASGSNLSHPRQLSGHASGRHSHDHEGFSTRSKRSRMRCVLGVAGVPDVILMFSRGRARGTREATPVPAVTELAGGNRRVVTSGRL